MSIQIGSISCYIYTPDQLSSFLIKTSPPHLRSTQLPAKHVKKILTKKLKKLCESHGTFTKTSFKKFYII